MRNSVVKNIITQAAETSIETEQGTLIAKPCGGPDYLGISIYLRPKGCTEEILLSVTEFVADGSNISAGEVLPLDRVPPHMMDKVADVRDNFAVAGSFIKTTPGFQSRVYENIKDGNEEPRVHLHYNLT